jgi:hypothetical protein
MTKRKINFSISGIFRGLRKWFLKIMKRENERLEKNEWKNTWVENISESPIGTTAQILDALVFMVFGGFIQSVILVFFFYLMIYKDQFINSLVNMMVDESLRYGMDFPKVYASFGAAIIIVVFMFLSAFLLYRRSQYKVNLSKGLAEIAYRLEHLTGSTIAVNDEPGPKPVATDPTGPTGGEGVKS